MKQVANRKYLFLSCKLFAAERKLNYTCLTKLKINNISPVKYSVLERLNILKPMSCF